MDNDGLRNNREISKMTGWQNFQQPILQNKDVQTCLTAFFQSIISKR